MFHLFRINHRECITGWAFAMRTHKIKSNLEMIQLMSGITDNIQAM
jgi:hypothetical protein